jgi:hypothetical protein
MGAAQGFELFPLNQGQKAGNQVFTNGCSSIGRVAVSKTVGWEFESLHPCKRIDRVPGSFSPAVVIYKEC